MERYLKVESLRMALGDQANLPSAEELQRLMAETEISLFKGTIDVPESLLKTGWYLHSVASSRKSLELYSYERQRRAYQISAHIFDMALKSRVNGRAEALSYVFAAQIGYFRGGLNPNATALYKSLDRRDRDLDISTGNIALEVGVMLLAMDRHALFDILPILQEQLETMDSVRDGKFNYTRLLLDACWNLLLYLSYGIEGSYQEAIQTLLTIVRTEDDIEDLDARWVAAHLHDIAEDFGQSSIWSILPPEISPSAAKAMTLGTPPVLTLWPPQVQLLRRDDTNNPLQLSTKRLFLSVPTSAGKTLLAQFISLTHLAQEGGGICFVAPSHSLCREIRKSLSDRLRLLKQEVAEEVPFGFWPEIESNLEVETQSVEVMTPESLSFLLRYKPKETLNKFKLFIIDEAHLLAEDSRGWGLEATLSLLQLLTRDSEHRIVLMSSCLGNQTHMVQWIGVNGANKSFHSEWRGPRRLYALYTPERSRRVPVEEIEHARKGKVEKHFKYQMDGIMRLKVADTSQVHLSMIEESVGVDYTRPDSRGTYRKDSKKATPFYKTIAPLARDLAKAGPVLVIVSTRPESQNLAREIAEIINEEDPRTIGIANLASARLGAEHLLSKTLKKGVAFHHAALPSDLQAAIESGVKDGDIKFIVSTTTLADGVNLPVRTVIIGNTGAYTSTGFKEFITGSKLINAIGRAGRSGKESEGWIVLADPQYQEGHFNQLTQSSSEDTALISQLTTDSALLSLSLAEASLRASEDNVFKLAASRTSDFLSYIWVVANSLTEVHEEVESEDIKQFLESTLAWQQMNTHTRQRWLAVAQVSYAAYQSTNSDKRRRWARSGTSLSTANKLEKILHKIAEECISFYVDNERSLDLEAVLDIILSAENIKLLFSLPEAPKTGFYLARNSKRDSPIDTDYKSLLLDWVNGVDLAELVEKYLPEVKDKEYAYESIGEYITNIYEHYLPWMMGTLINWINELSQPVLGDDELIESRIPGYIRYGVNNRFSLDLMMNGVTSRQLATRVGGEFFMAEGLSLRKWLRRMKLADFIENFDADERELRDLVNYLRPRDSTILASFINGEEVELDYTITGDMELSGEVRFAYLDGDSFPSRLGIRQDGIMTCDMPLQLYVDIEELVATGLPYKAELFLVGNRTYGVRVKMLSYGQNEVEF